MTDALSNYKPKSSGLFLRFNDGDEIKLRVLTTDPLISENTWEKGDETVVSTKYSFVVWNHNEDKAQVLSVGSGLLNQFVKLHKDEDLPLLNKMDIKISATGENLKRRYSVIALPEAKPFTADMVKRASEIKLEEAIKDYVCRLSEAQTDEDTVDLEEEVEKSGYEKAKELSDTLKGKTKATQATNTKPITKEEVAEAMDIPVEDLEDVIEETINLEDIPF